MKRLTAKMRRLRTTCWNKLTLGEKAIKIIMSLIKMGLIIALIAAFASMAIAIGIGIAIAIGIGNAIAGGFGMASRAYRPGDIYVRFR